MDKIGIIDFRNIIKVIQEVYNIDFSDYALTSLKRRLEKVMTINCFNTVDEMLMKLKDSSDFFENFLFDISVEDTEMFRDPSFWRELKDVILPKTINGTEYSIWMPDLTSGEELFSLAIVLQEMEIFHNTKIIATSMSQKNLDTIKSGVLDSKKMEINIANYKRMKSKDNMQSYFVETNGKVEIDLKLIENVHFEKINMLTDKLPTKVKLILYRNKLIYFNQPLQSRVLSLLHQALVPGGHFVIGIKETLDIFNTEKKFLQVDESENIFKKLN